MEILMLGTGASQGIPGIYCDCDRCRAAVQRGGHELRSRTSTLVDGICLIDAGPDSYMQFVREGLSHRNLSAVIHTHSHDDHFATELYRRRYPVYTRSPMDRRLTVAANDAVRTKLEAIVDLDQAGIDFLAARPFEPFDVDHLQVTPLPASHAPNEECLLYLITDGKKRAFFANDTGYLPEATWRFLREEEQGPLDLVIMDGTWIDEPRGSDHMSLEQNVAVRERLLQDGIAHEGTRFVLTHIGHFGSMGHVELRKAAAPLGLEPGYDGMSITL